MKQRMQILLAILEAAFILVAVYFEPSYCVRGKLWGEAFFDGRPTSYWRVRCDEWLERFDSPESAVFNLYPNIMAGGQFIRLREPRPRRQNVASRFYDWFSSAEQRERDAGPPSVLFGEEPESEPVLLELATQEKHWELAVSALFRVKRNKRHRVQEAAP